MKLAIIGSRSFDHMNLQTYQQVTERILHYLKRLARESDDTYLEIVSGGANGIDKIARLFAQQNYIPYKEFLANWKLFGKRAGYLRNRDIAQYSDRVLAIWDGKSRGTMHTVNLAKSFEKPADIIKMELEHENSMETRPTGLG